MHSERLLDHFQNPRNPGELAPPAVKVDVTNPACGDMLRLSARFENGRVAEARFLTRGCTAAIASSSALTEWMTGKTPAELTLLTPAMIEDERRRPGARLETRRRAVRRRRPPIAGRRLANCVRIEDSDFFRLSSPYPHPVRRR